MREYTADERKVAWLLLRILSLQEFIKELCAAVEYLRGEVPDCMGGVTGDCVMWHENGNCDECSHKETLKERNFRSIRSQSKHDVCLFLDKCWAEIEANK